MTFPKAEPSASHASISKLVDASTEHQDVALVQGFRKLHITSQSCTSLALLKALASVKVYQAASEWDIDRLMIEAGQRFGGYVSGAFDRDDFPQFVDAVFNSVTGPAELLYGPLVQECFIHCQHLANNTNFLAILEHNGKLAVRLYRELAKFQASFNNGTSTTPTPSALGAGGSTSDAASSAVTLLRGQLTEARDAVSAKDEQIKTLKQELARLKDSVQHKTSTTDLESQLAQERADKADKDAIIDNLEGQLGQKDEKINDFGRTLSDVNARNAQLVRQINSQRTGQSGSTSFLLECNGARESAGKLQVCLDASETKIKELETQLAAHCQQPLVVNPVFTSGLSTRNTTSPVQPSQPIQRPQDAEPKRHIIGYGSMTASMNSIAAGSGSATVSESPASPTPAPSVRPVPVPAAHSLISAGGPVSYVEKVQRSRAADVHGGEHEDTTSRQAPTTMPVRTRGASIEVQQSLRSPSVTPSTSSTIPTSALSPVNGAPRGPHVALSRRAAGPHSPQSNGDPHTASTTSSVDASSHVNGIPQPVTPRECGDAVNFSGGSASARGAGGAGSAAPVESSTTPSAAAGPSTAPSVIVSNGQVNGFIDERDRIIQQLNAHNNSLQTQLNAARGKQLPCSFCFLILTSTAHARDMQSNRPPHNGSSRGKARLRRVLNALKEYDLDHKACNDCSINFNAQWRGMVDNIDEPDLILMCNKCGNEKCRWRC